MKPPGTRAVSKAGVKNVRRTCFTYNMKVGEGKKFAKRLSSQIPAGFDRNPIIYRLLMPLFYKNLFIGIALSTMLPQKTPFYLPHADC
jgi:hypothetical protein